MPNVLYYRTLLIFCKNLAYRNVTHAIELFMFFYMDFVWFASLLGIIARNCGAKYAIVLSLILSQPSGLFLLQFCSKKVK